MEHLVVDSNILIASFIESDSLHLESQQYIAGLENESCMFHLPILVIIEIFAAISRQSTANRFALLARAGQSLRAWERSGEISLYPFDRERLELAVTIAQRDRLPGADSVIAALAEELEMPLKTFDKEILERFSTASG